MPAPVKGAAGPENAVTGRPDAAAAAACCRARTRRPPRRPPRRRRLGGAQAGPGGVGEREPGRPRCRGEGLREHVGLRGDMPSCSGVRLRDRAAGAGGEGELLPEREIRPRSSTPRGKERDGLRPRGGGTGTGAARSSATSPPRRSHWAMVRVIFAPSVVPVTATPPRVRIAGSILKPTGLSQNGLSQNGNPFFGEKSASILMKILWLARLSRPDLCHSVTKLASGITKWSINHDKMLYRLVCYMQGTLDFGVMCSVRGSWSDISLHLYTDADLGGDVCSMKSHSGIYLAVECPNGTHFPISWSSRRQQCVSKSTTESEIVALSDGLFGDAIPVQTVLNMIFDASIPVVLHEDNQSCIHIINAGYSAKLKHLNRTHKLSIASLSETVASLGYSLTYTDSNDQLADMFTKALVKLKFTEALRKLRISAPPHSVRH